jgi:exopolysaccharide biosynthesis protein
VVSDGRTDESQGLTLQELAQFMQKLGVKTAYNLDGGGSSTMYYNKEVVNNPTTSGRNISERKVSDIVYIGKRRIQAGSVEIDTELSDGHHVLPGIWRDI